ncbi:MAG: bifunctional homocysteine S-methyltransferase/methylenetetrahydrofolate reductase [Anaerolineae bacterium]|nr:bifunctional homocysteine S-methyltransferase/methylenetetrahydrofolate reductase [Anaerolineae bacterium]
MASTGFRERLRQGPVLADGAMGTLLYGQGLPIDSCFNALNLTDPARIAGVHRAYIEAGAEVIKTNTFDANRFKLAAHGLASEVAALNHAGAELVRRAADTTAAPHDVYVAGSIGPLGVQLEPVGRVRARAVFDAFRAQIAALVEAGVDLLLFETFALLDEITEAVRAARAVSADIPIVAQVTFTRDGRLLLGESPQQAARTLAALDVDVIGANCGSGPAQVMRAVERMRGAAPGAVYSAMPNAGWPEHVGGRVMYAAAPDYFAEYALAFVGAGVTLVGGCCGTTPAHIAAMRAALDHPDAYLESSPPIAVREAAALPASPEEPTRLARALDAGRFMITVEVAPPKGIMPERVIAGARMLVEAGADFINIADSPMARMRMSPWAVAHLLQEAVGVEAILHFPTRGRNLLRIQGDLLAAHALGVRNLFIVMGDPTRIGDYPDAADAYDVAPSGLVRLVKCNLNAGADQAGNSIGTPTSFVAGCALNMGAPDPAHEIRVLKKKIDAGADFALTQPVYDPAAVRRFFDAYAEAEGRPLDLPVLVGLLPLYNARHARFLHHEVPGITIPDALMQRMVAAEARGADAGASEGVKIACEIVAGLKAIAGVRGLYVMPAFGRYNLAAEIIDCVRERDGA